MGKSKLSIRIILLLATFTIGSVLHAQVQEVGSVTKLIDDSGFEGSFLAYDLHADRFRAGHSERISKALIPASTFKIFSALVALETAVVFDNSSVIKWDGVIRNRPELNSDLTLEDAFRLSAVPHFQHLVRSIGHERMQHYIDLVGYGNRDISGGNDSFWLEGNLRISPQQQVEFLVRLYRNDLPFRPEVMDTVKSIMGSESTENYVLRSKTGLAVLLAEHNVGWWVGWVEQDEEVTFFAIALEAHSPDASFIPARIGIAREALNSLGVAINRQ